MTDRPIRKIDIDGAYRVHFDPTINYRDRQSKYAAAYAKLHDASLIYVAERLSTKWAFRLWNPPCNRINNRLGECRNEIRRDFRDRLVEDGLGKSLAKNGLYFENMKWGTNARYAIYERETERDYTFGSFHVQFEGVDGLLPHGSVADYSVYFVYSGVIPMPLSAMTTFSGVSVISIEGLKLDCLTSLCRTASKAFCVFSRSSERGDW